MKWKSQFRGYVNSWPMGRGLRRSVTTTTSESCYCDHCAFLDFYRVNQCKLYNELQCVSKLFAVSPQLKSGNGFCTTASGFAFWINYLEQIQEEEDLLNLLRRRTKRRATRRRRTWVRQWLDVGRGFYFWSLTSAHAWNAEWRPCKFLKLLSYAARHV